MVGYVRTRTQLVCILFFASLFGVNSLLHFAQRGLHMSLLVGTLRTLNLLVLFLCVVWGCAHYLYV